MARFCALAPHLNFRITVRWHCMNKPGIDVPRPNPVQRWVIDPAISLKPGMAHTMMANRTRRLAMHQGPLLAPIHESPKCQLITFPGPLFDVAQPTIDLRCNIEVPPSQLKPIWHVFRAEAHCFFHPIRVVVDRSSRARGFEILFSIHFFGDSIAG